MGIISTATDTWVQVESERATKEGYVLWAKPGRFGQVYYLTDSKDSPPDKDKGGFYTLDILFHAKGLTCSQPDLK